MNRRNFIKTTLAGAGAMATYNMALSQTQNMLPMPMGFLGSTNEIVSALGVDCFPFAYESMTVPTISKILNRAIELGINLVDVSPDYNDAESKIGEVIPYIRDRVFLSTKVTQTTFEGAQRQIEQSLQFMKVDQIDLVVFKNFGDVKTNKDLDFLYSAKGAMEALRKAKQNGLIRFIGIGGHVFPTRFHEAINRGGIDVLMNPANFIIKNTYDFEHKVWSRAKTKNIGIIAMDILGAYNNAGVHVMPSDKFNSAIQYAKSIPGVGSSIIGFRSVAELEKAASAFTTLKTLSENEKLSLIADGAALAKTSTWRRPYGDPID